MCQVNSQEANYRHSIVEMMMMMMMMMMIIIILLYNSSSSGIFFKVSKNLALKVIHQLNTLHLQGKKF
jgi:uncharacterized membrane-anchored protein